MSSKIIGIDAGTGRMKVCTIDATSRTRVIAFADGNSTMPSCVYFRDGQEPVTGVEAADLGLIDPKNCVKHWKRDMGNSKVLYTDSKKKEYRAKDILAILLKECLIMAERDLGTVGLKAVITVPANYTDNQKQETLDAAEVVGIECIKTVHEPTAALFARTIDNNNTVADGERMVCDIGCGTTDISIQQKAGNCFNTVTCNGIQKLGGLDYTERMVNYCIDQFKNEHNILITQHDYPEEYADLFHRCENAKLRFANINETSVPIVVQGKKCMIKLDRATVDKITKDLTDSIIDCVKKTVSESGHSMEDFAELVPIGGGSQLFCVLESLENMFGRPVSNHADPHLAVAKGAVVAARQKIGEVESDDGHILPPLPEVMRDITAHALGVLAYDQNNNKFFSQILKKGVPMPSKYIRVYQLSDDGATGALIQILQGEENQDPDTTEKIGEFMLENLQPVFGEPHKVEVHLAIDENGILHAQAFDPLDGTTAEAKLTYQK